MTFEAMAFKFCPLHIKLSTSNFKLKKGLSSCDKPFFTTNYMLFIDDLLNNADGFFQFVPGDVERRQEAQEAISGEN